MAVLLVRYLFLFKRWAKWKFMIIIIEIVAMIMCCIAMMISIIILIILADSVFSDTNRFISFCLQSLVTRGERHNS